ncbi:hypothetical protein HPP92_013565 [Vanilla planifolia]|uniref:Uncharacterized protein n=1 Tax=Vanilla planifolia TaxID=51239 RepID=A0A835UUY0_VANPL|nr:hypothetical protein HPP92_013565 [Vanilla planifolia]
MGCRCCRAAFVTFVLVVSVLVASIQSSAAARPMRVVYGEGSKIGPSAFQEAKESLELLLMRLPSGPSDRGAGH